ncbi:hypothetical protein LEP1GSC021_2707 [Leptospira noguchii str. 1993005606]|uniref:Uncharacterized protein n=1 Tax=Leptospira noguchii str. 2007001578 TaxID=1049974 RepID=A0ABP2TC22_9LEPT|nr:hypothetical protein LEP1GSC035_2293 [Leptospira noguchii str. 2007001578]EPE83642.1 hypothetical protein LEP1GSC021_2707 [Leptospira noguchii str. 1993005606]
MKENPHSNFFRNKFLVLFLYIRVVNTFEISLKNPFYFFDLKSTSHFRSFFPVYYSDV